MLKVKSGIKTAKEIVWLVRARYFIDELLIKQCRKKNKHSKTIEILLNMVSTRAITP